MIILLLFLIVDMRLFYMIPIEDRKVYHVIPLACIIQVIYDLISFYYLLNKHE